jgi:hypothetical protein
MRLLISLMMICCSISLSAQDNVAHLSAEKLAKLLPANGEFKVLMIPTTWKKTSTDEANQFAPVCEWMDDGITSSLSEVLGERLQILSDEATEVGIQYKQLNGELENKTVVQEDFRLAPQVYVAEKRNGKFAISLTIDVLNIAKGSKKTSRVEGIIDQDSILADLVGEKLAPIIGESLINDEIVSPDNKPSELSPLLTPVGSDIGRKNFQEVNITRPGGRLRSDFIFEARTKDSRNLYFEGEQVVYDVFSERDCHVAILAHFCDGTSYQLFPNGFCKDTAVKAGQWVQIPGPKKVGFKFTVAEPYGIDVVHIMAAESPEQLQELFNVKYPNKGDSPYPSLQRGSTVDCLKRGQVVVADTQASAPDSPKARVAVKQLQINTRPKVFQK